ncbi:XS domain [Macleaya cordata]|uniref:XS domain n=1 Tax=Macleaya cordata TaxID=56857 RepID=A0A200Q4P1_MACCD|nr:XS domain [Macleaya cordata]
MTGGNPKGSSSHKSSASSSSYRKSRWESGNNTPSDHKSNAANNDSKSEKPSSNAKDDSTPGPSSKPQPDQTLPPSGPGMFRPPGHGHPFHLPETTGSPFTDPANFGPPPPPAYGFHMLERRTIALADGSVRSYFALPPDYQDFPPPGRLMDHNERFFPFGPGGREPEPGSLGLGFDKHFPHDGFQRDRGDPYGRSGQSDYWNSLGLDGRGPMPPEASLKRKYGDEDERDARDDFTRQRQQLLQYGNPNSNPNGFPLGPGDRGVDYLAGTSSPFARDSMMSGRGTDDLRSSKHIRVGGDYGSSHSRHGEIGNDSSTKLPDVDPQALKKSFLHYVKLLNENPSQRKNYLENGKHGSLQCLTCGRASKEFPDMHGLIMHTYNSTDLRVDHLGLHKALCVLMGWNYAKAPENSKAYQSLSADEAAASMDDLIMWPPLVIIHNTNSGRGKDGHVEGMGNKTMDNKLKDIGFIGGKSKSLYGKDGHLGITLVKFGGDQSGLKEAMRLAEYFEKDNHGRRGWVRTQSMLSGRDDENNPNLVKVDPKTGEKTRILYGYLGTASDLDKIDFDTRKKTLIESRREFKPSN